MNIILPKIEKKVLDINRNSVSQLLEKEKTIDVEIVERLNRPNGIVVRNTRNHDEKYFICTSNKCNKEKFPIALKVDSLDDNLTETKNGAWINHTKLEIDNSTQDILDSWNFPFSYKSENLALSITGLRPPQIAAVHAIHSHWISGNEPGIIVMPTGTGKTETMLSTLVSFPCDKILIIVPTDALRTQIAEKFKTLGLLKELGVIPSTYLNPKVAILRSKPKNLQEVNAICDSSNVIVSTINIVGQMDEMLIERVAQHCNYLFFDEAHHIVASTWKNVKIKFNSKRILQFTATPFRNDKESIGDKVFYKYSLKKAYDDGYFKKIHFRPVHEYDPSLVDRMIVEKGIAQLRSDPSSHILMARVNSIDRAHQVFELYSSYSEFSPVEIHTGIKSEVEQRRIRELITSGISRIVVCVDMLGEGFDLPELKIAAFHDIRKSLAVTLQLAGRFTRSRNDLGEPTFIANVADIDVRRELQALYNEDPDWTELLADMSEAAIGDEIAKYEFAEGFRDFPKEFPIGNLFPATSCVVYKTSCAEWNPIELFRIYKVNSPDRIFHSINHSEKTMVVIISRKVNLDWIHVSEVYNWEWELLIFYWNSDLNLLFINSSSNAGMFKKFAKSIAGENVELIQGNDVYRSFHGINRLLLYNVGLKKQLGRLISFTMHAGSGVEQGLSAASLRNVSKSNLFGAGYEDASKVSVGSSLRGRIWSRKTTSILGLINWCNNIGAKLIDETIDGNRVLEGALKPRLIGALPNKVVIRIDWPDLFYTHPETTLNFQVDGDPNYFIHNLDISVIPQDGTLEFLIETENTTSKYNFEVTEDGDIKDFQIQKVSGANINFKNSGNYIPIEEFFKENPPVFWYGDGSSLEGNSYIELNNTPQSFPNEKMISWDWTGVNIRKESQKITKEIDSIQFRVIQNLVNQNYEVIYNDDDKGEAADVIAIKTETTGNDIKLIIELYHCKFSSSSSPGNRLDDLYVVCGQAQRSAHFREDPIRLLRHLLRRNPIRRSGREFSRYEVGDKNTLLAITQKAYQAEVIMKVFIVQPGVSISGLTEEQNKLLAVTDNYLMETYQLPFYAIFSA